jgi:hypothetical protein
MVPSVNNVALSGPAAENGWPRAPNHFGGYQLDARVGTLQEQALGALTNHAEIQSPAPPRILDDLAAFQRVLFANERVRALSDAVAAGTAPLPDPDPALDPVGEDVDRQRAFCGYSLNSGTCRFSTSSRMMVSERSEPVDTMAAGTPVTSSSLAM